MTIGIPLESILDNTILGFRIYLAMDIEMNAMM